MKYIIFEVCDGFFCRLTVMTRKAFVANMMSQDTLQLSGFPKDLWSPRSEFLRFCVASCLVVLQGNSNVMSND